MFFFAVGLIKQIAHSSFHYIPQILKRIQIYPKKDLREKESFNLQKDALNIFVRMA